MKFEMIKIDFNDIKTIQWIALAFLLIVLIIDLLLFSSIGQNIHQAKMQRDKEKSAIVFFKDLISKKDSLIKAKVIPIENIDDVMDKIQKIAQKDNLEAKADVFLDNDDSVAGNLFYAQKNFTMEAVGSFKDLAIFLTAVRNMPDAVVDIASVQLDADKTDTSSVIAKINFIVFTTKDNDDK